MQTSLFHTNKSYLTECININKSCLQKSLHKSFLPKYIDKSCLPKCIDKNCLPKLVYNREKNLAASVSTTLKSVLNITALNSVYYRGKICALV